MRFIKDGKPAEDRFQRVDDDGPIPGGAPVLLSAKRFLAEAASLAARTAPVGVIWPNNRDIVELAPHLARLATIALVFPSFRDGRAYSQARLLRQRHKYSGELRATGQVLRDQFLFMLRAGFTAFEVVKDSDAEAFPQVIHRYTRYYQPSVDRRPVIAQERQAQDEETPIRAHVAS
ncbi:MAG TPA: DUF934 domain-containing protein [Stellaceae bacterium]|jgi:uncharacterized protein (DUF934 family)|nr:DUF934 domain-containing protein [Stellaceae bacterium]